MKGGYFLFNGRFYKEGDAVFTLSDVTAGTAGFIESFRAEYNEVLFQESVSNHLISTANSLDIDLTGLLDDEGRLLQKDVSRLLNKNKLYLAAKIIIQIYPSDNQINIILYAEEMERGFYQPGEPGLLLSFYEEQFKETLPYFTFSPFCSFIQNSAQRYAAAFDKSNLIVRNNEGYACESIGGSFAFIEKEMVYFTAPGSGGYRCAIREEVIRSVKEAGLIPLDKEQITQDDLLNAEEVFLYDACHGIRKVLGLEDQRYFSTKTRVISEKLTSLAKQYRKEKG